MNLYTWIPPRVREYLLLSRGMIKQGKKKLLDEIHMLSQKDSADWYSSSCDPLCWEKSFKRLALESNSRGIQLARSFYQQPLQIIEEKQVPRDQSFVLICASKNECNRMKSIYQYYRKLGVNSFAFIDNFSTDDSIKIYRTMEGVNIYLAKESYTSIRRQAWINRVMAHYGYDKWYLVIDSDEYIDYNQSEQHSLIDVIRYCNLKKIFRLQALLVDMYPKEIEYKNQKIDFLKEYIYFDWDTYEAMNDQNQLLLNGYQGGVRARLFFQSETKNKPWLTKYPLIFLQQGDIQFQSHMSFPFYKNFQSKNYLAIKHYKFLPNDFEKYKQRVSSGNFANGSQEYKQYIAEMKKGYIKFYDNSHSERCLTSESFYKIPVMAKIPWEDLL